MCGARSRWKKGNDRYTKADETANAKYREGPGWRNGAKVRKK